MIGRVEKLWVVFAQLLAVCVLFSPSAVRSQTDGDSLDPSQQKPNKESTEDYNRKLEQLLGSLPETPRHQSADYKIGPEDVLEIKVFQASDLNRPVRVSAGGDVSFPLLGSIHAAGLTAQEFEALVEYKLHPYMKDPHVDVLVSSVESHPISVVGAVKKPGVFQVRGPKTVLEILSLAEGLADDAGDDVLIMRGAGLDGKDSQATNQQLTSGPATSETSPKGDAKKNEPGGGETVRVNLKDLLESGDARLNAPVYAGDIVKVPRAGIVYVVGEVKKPGGFVMKSNEQMTVMKAMALAEGLTLTAVKDQARIIRTDPASGEEKEIPIHLGKIVDGKAPDPILQAADILFIPNSAGKYAVFRGSEAAISAITSLLVFRW